MSASRIRGSRLPRNLTTSASPTRSTFSLTWLAGYAEEFLKIDLGDGVPFSPGHDDLAGNNGQGQRQFDRNGGAFAVFRDDVDVAAEFVQVGLDDIHADTAAGDIGDLCRRGKTWEKNDVNLLFLRHQLNLFRGQ